MGGNSSSCRAFMPWVGIGASWGDSIRTHGLGVPNYTYGFMLCKGDCVCKGCQTLSSTPYMYPLRPYPLRPYLIVLPLTFSHIDEEIQIVHLESIILKAVPLIEGGR